MARRLHHDKRRRVMLTARRVLALTVGPDPSGDEPRDVLRAVWEEHRGQVLADQRPGTMPWAWWAWEPGVPDPLRGDWPGLYPVGDADAREARATLADRRAAWLAEGHAAV